MKAPGPSWLQSLAMLPRFRRDPLLMLHEWSSTWGDVVRVGAGPRTFHLVTRPEHVGHVLQHNHKSYTKRTIGYRSLSKVLGNGLVTSEGREWRERRRLAQPAFHREQIAAFAKTMTDATEEMLAAWADAQTIDVTAEMMALTYRIVSRTLMHGGEIDVDEAELREQITIVMEYVADRMMSMIEWPDWLPTPSNRRFRATVREFDRKVYEGIAQRRSGEFVADDLMSMLMHARDPETGIALSDEELRDEVVTIMGAGHETTASALSWTWHLLSIHPEIEAQLHAEVDAVLAGRMPALHDLPKLPYTAAVLKESMRLFPPVWTLARQAIADDEIGGYRIPRGSMVLVSPWLTHRHPDYWEAPERFDPARFLESGAHETKFAYFPFGAGPRICIGNNFAMMEGTLILARVAQRFRLERAASAPVPKPTVTLRPADPLLMKTQLRPAPAGALDVAPRHAQCSGSTAHGWPSPTPA